MQADADWLRPEWAGRGAAALMTTRRGGVSLAPFDAMNIREGIGDDPTHVAENRRRLVAAMSEAAGAGVAPVWLNQVHGARVVRLTQADLAPNPLHAADAAITTEHGIACTAQVADCLPVLFTAPGGVGAAHAGWRGLAAGVLEATLAALCDATGCRPAQVQAWLGPCIGPRRFEVGVDVFDAFGAGQAGSAAGAAFTRREAGDGAVDAAFDRSTKWLADLPLLARQRLRAAGTGVILGGRWCTVEEPSRFFSYRRDGVTGRMVATVFRT